MERYSGKYYWLNREGEEDFGTSHDRATLKINQLVYRLTGQNWARPDWSAVGGYKILDIGCGTGIGSPDNGPLGETYPPEMCRLLAAHGAVVYGIDIEQQAPEDREIFTHITTDVVPHVLKGRLAKVPGLRGIEFDAITTMAFVGWDCSPTLERRLSEENISVPEFEERMLEQVKGMVVENGVILMETRHFRKVNGELQSLPQINGAI